MLVCLGHFSGIVRLRKKILNAKRIQESTYMTEVSSIIIHLHSEFNLTLKYKRCVKYNIFRVNSILLYGNTKDHSSVRQQIYKN